MYKDTTGRFSIAVIGKTDAVTERIAGILSENDNVRSVTKIPDLCEARRNIPCINAAVIFADSADRETAAFAAELSERNIPCAVITSANEEKADLFPFAAAVMKKPSDLSEYGTFCAVLITRLILASRASENSPCSCVPRGKVSPVPPTINEIAGLDKCAKDGFVIALGASTGGTDALECVLKTFPPEMPPVLVVQHMPPGFTKLYSERLDKCCAMRVKEACDGDRLKQGLCLIAAGGSQMELKTDFKGYYVKCGDPRKVSGHCPSVDVLFSSIAETAGKKAAAALMTGMGSDGAKGLLKLHDMGAYTVAQDRESCAVYGMPMEACRLGACSEQLPLADIGRILCRRLTEGW